MNPEEVLSLLESIGAMLSPTAQKVWVITLRNAVLQGYINLAWAIVTFLGALVCIRGGCHGLALQKKCEPSSGYPTPAEQTAKDFAENLALGGFIAAAIFMVAFIPLITAAVSYLSVPEYRAMQNLMNMLRGTP